VINRRLAVSLTTGAFLGLLCIAGAYARSGFELNQTYLFALWYNRVIMGMVIGLAGNNKSLPFILIRGALLGLAVSLAFFSASFFQGTVSFAAGIIYGVIIEYSAFRYGHHGNKVI